MEEGALLVNGEVRNERRLGKTEDGMRLLLVVPEAQPVDIVPQNIPLDILYQDADVVVVNKPSGMVVHPAAGNESGTLVNALALSRPRFIRHRGRNAAGNRPSAGQRHLRPDFDCEKRCGSRLRSASNSRRERWKSITAPLRTVPFLKDEGMIDAPIGRHPIDRKKMAVVPNGKPSRTAWRVLERFKRRGLSGCASCSPGSTHQIRVHMLSIGHPLLGDQIYAPKLKTPVRIPRLMLHAYSLAFTHPTTGERMRFCAPLPAAFEETLQKLR